jgi:predicted outer membrane protein
MNAYCNTTARFALAALTLAAFASGARADDPTPDPYTHMTTSTRSRAEVQAEVLAARADGSLARLRAEDGGAFHFARQVWASGKTRAEVKAEVLQARRNGEGFAMYGEDSGSFYLSRANAASADAVRLAKVTR